MTTGIDLVLVGYRPGALHAASNLGLSVLLVEDKPPSASARRRIVRAVQAPLEGDEASLLARTREALGDDVPRAVVSAGERGVLAAAALREAFGLGGIDRETAWRTRDKPRMKQAVRAAGIPCTDWLELDTTTTPADLVAALGLPLVLKERTGSGTRGLIRARSEDEVAAGLASIPAEQRARWMGERFVHGAEMSLESFIADGQILLVNPTEYYVTGFANIAPAALPEKEAAVIHQLNADVIRALGIRRGMTHLELYRTADGPVFGEIAVRPPGGRIMRLLRRVYDFDPWRAVIELELDGGVPDLPAQASRAGGVWMLHPGPGKVRSVCGLAAARRVLGVRKLVVRVRAGKVLASRSGTGSDVGWLEVRGRNRDQVAERMQRAYDQIQITMLPAADVAGDA